MFEEHWNVIPGCSRYEVSNLGYVRSNVRGTPRILRFLPGQGGYRAVCVRTDERKELRMFVHRFVMLAFVGPLPEGLCTRHLDGNKYNNSLDNLAYGTYEENAQDELRLGRNTNLNKTHCKRGHEFTSETTYYTKQGWRMCRICVNLKGAQYAAVKKANKAKRLAALERPQD